MGLHVLADDANALYPSTPIRPVLWPGDLVIRPFVKLCQSIHGENVTISFTHEYRRHTLTSRCDVISDVMNIKNTFYVIMCDVLSISYVKMNLSQIFRNFQNGCHFEVNVRYWTGSCTGIWVIHQDMLCHSLHFEILFDVLALILTELWLFQNLTYFLILWPSYGTFVLHRL